MNLQSELNDALFLAAAARPDQATWSGPASSALNLRIDSLIAELTALASWAAEIELSSAGLFWSSASLIG